MKVVGEGSAVQVRTATESYCNAILNGNATHVLIRCHNDSPHVDLHDEDVDMNGGITVTTILNPDEDMTFGRAISTEVVMYLIKNAKTDSIDWTQNIQLNIGVERNGVTQYVTVSSFIGSEPKRIVRNGMNILVYTGYDYMRRYEAIADGFVDSLTFPTTGDAIIDAFEAYYSNAITVNSGFPGHNYTISKNPFPKGCTFRDILGWLAEAAAGYAEATAGTTNVNIFSYNELPYSITYTLTPDSYFEINKSDYNVPSVPALRIVDSNNMSNTRSYPATYTGVPYDFINNPILNSYTNAEKDAILTSFYNNRSYLSGYTPMNVTAIGNWLIEVGDIIDVVDLDGNTVQMPIFSHTLKWNGGCVSYLENTGNPERKLSEAQKEQYYIDGKYVQRAELGNAAECDVTNDLETATEGYVLDARQGKLLNDTKVSFATISLTANTQKTINVADSSRLVCFYMASSIKGMSIAISTTTGTVTNQVVGTLSGVTFNVATANQLKVTATSNCTMYILVFQGSVS